MFSFSLLAAHLENGSAPTGSASAQNALATSGLRHPVLQVESGQSTLPQYEFREQVSHQVFVKNVVYGVQGRLPVVDHQATLARRGYQITSDDLATALAEQRPPIANSDEYWKVMTGASHAQTRSMKRTATASCPPKASKKKISTSAATKAKAPKTSQSLVSTKTSSERRSKSTRRRLARVRRAAKRRR